MLRLKALHTEGFRPCFFGVIEVTQRTHPSIKQLQRQIKVIATQHIDMRIGSLEIAERYLLPLTENRFFSTT